MGQDIVVHFANLLDGPYTVGYSYTVLQLHLWRGFLVRTYVISCVVLSKCHAAPTDYTQSTPPSVPAPLQQQGSLQLGGKAKSPFWLSNIAYQCMQLVLNPSS